MEIFDFSLDKKDIEKIDELKSKLIFTADFENKLKSISMYIISLND